MLLHLDGNYTDEMGNTTSITPSDNFVSGKFGMAYYSTTNNFLQFYIGDNPIGTQDFTIDFWAYCLDYTTAATFRWLFTFYPNYSTGQSGCFNYRVKNDGSLQYSYYDGSWHDTLVGATLPLNTWTHLCVERINGVLTFFVDGIVVYTLSLPSFYIAEAPNSYLDIGNCYANAAQGRRNFNGYIDEFRMIVGQAQWTDNFTPPTTPYNI